MGINRKHKSDTGIKSLLIIVCIFFAGTTYAQNNPFKINDSLYPLYLQCIKTQGTSAGLEACENMYRHATELHDQKGQCIALVQKVKHYFRHRPIDRINSLKAIDECKRFSIKTPYKQYYFNAWVSLIIFYINHEDYNNAMKEVKAFQKKAIELQNDYGVAESYRQLGHIFYMLGLYDQAIIQYEKCVDFYVSHGNERQSYEIYHNIACCYYDKGNMKAGEENAIAYMRKCPDELHKLSGLILLLTHLNNSADKTQARQYFKQMCYIVQKYGYGRVGKDSYFSACSRYYTVMGETLRAIAYSDSIVDKNNNSLLISSSLFAAGNFEQAYNSLSSYLQRKDSLNTVKVSQTIAMYSAQFNLDQIEMERKELELKTRQIALENEQKNYLINRENDSIKFENQTLRLQDERQRHTSDSLRYAKERERQRFINDAQEQRMLYISVIGAIILLSFACYILYSIIYSRRLKKEKRATEKALDISRKAEKFQTMFLNNMSHEIRTPLNAIVGFTELLNNGTDIMPEEREELMKRITHNSDLLTTLVNDLLDLSRMQSGNYKLSFKETSAAELCTQACGTVSGKVPYGVKLIFDNPAGLENFTFSTDGNRTSQVLVNFLTNACKFTSTGSIVITYMVKENNIEFSVSDTGIGVSADKATEIFKRFEKLDEFKQGTGLGLNICATIASLLHGKVWLDTSYKNGARFILSLPLVQ